MGRQALSVAETPTAVTPAIAGPGIRTRNGFGESRKQILTTRIGLRFPNDLTFESWAQAGFQISTAVDSFAWCLGDWLVYGQHRYADRYRRAVEAVGLDTQTLRNYASVARRVPMSRRRGALSFQHHAEVAALPEAEQDRWLARAEECSWSRNQLRQYLRAARTGDPVPDSTTTAMPRVSVPQERVELWRAAAERSSSGFDSWVVTALDRAAKQVLGPGAEDHAMSA